MNFQDTVLEIIEEADKSKMPANKPRRIRQGEPGYGKKKFVVKAKEGSKEKIVRFGDANMTTAGNRQDEKSKARRADFRARHAKNIARGKLSGAYWSSRELW